MIKRMNKRGQGLSTNAIILIVLGVFVLAILVVGFMVGWNRIAPWLSNENVDNVVNSCETACTSGNVFSYCSKVRNLNDGEKAIDATCYALSRGDDFDAYAIKPCDLDCQLTVKCEDLNTYMVDDEVKTLIIEGSAPIAGTHCKEITEAE